jgi:penicillin-binding protein 1A
MSAHPFLRWLAIGFGAFAIVALAGTLVVALYIARIAKDLPDYSALVRYAPPITTRVQAGDGSLLAEFAKEHRLFVPIDEIPEAVQHAFVAAEDANFYKHGGIDFQGILRAAIANIGNVINHRRPEGGSTITQQVAKNFLLSSDQKLERKVKEALIARRIEKHFTKQQILELYLNQIYLGLGSYGVASAALQYFGKSLDELTIAESAYLAALPKAPNNYHPILERDRAIERRNYVLDRMAANGYITKQERDAGEKEDLVVFPRKMGTTFQEADYFVEEIRRDLYDRFGEKQLYEGGLSAHTTLDTDLQRVAQHVLREGLEDFDQTQGYRGPFAQVALDKGTWQDTLKAVIGIADIDEWTLAVVLNATEDRAEIGLANGERGHIPLTDLSWVRLIDKSGNKGPQPRRASDALKRGDVVYVAPMLREGENRQTTQDKRAQPAQIDHWSLRQVPGVNGALVAMDPHTGRVLALAGGFSYAMSEFDRSMQAQRQPGSAFKPFVYAAALDFDGGKRFTPSSLVLDMPFVMDQGAGLGFWKPENYDEDFIGPSTLRRGLEKSRNVMTVRLAQEIGMEMVLDYAHRFGIINSLPDFKPLSMALGAMDTTLMRMTAAYSMLVNGGKKITPILIDRVQDRLGHTIYRHDSRTCGSCAADAFDRAAGEPVLPDLREQVLDPRTAFQVVNMLTGVVQRGTGSLVAAVGKPLGGKTGTTNESRDAWFIGFSPDLAVGVFVGYDTPTPMGRLATGGLVAAPMFRDFMMAAIGDKPAIPFRTPPGIRLVRVRLSDGQPAGPGEPSVMEAFKSGTEPTGEATPVLAGPTPTLEQLGPDVTDGAPKPPTQPNIDSGTGGLY